MDEDTPQRRILFAATGLSPQIVTESLHALAVAAPIPWVPTEVHLVTTVEGAERARHSLLSADLAWFGRLIADYGLPPIAFTESHIHVLEDAAGTPLSDIRTPADNDQAADQLTELVRRFTADPTTVLHALIAGGRKTIDYPGRLIRAAGREVRRPPPTRLHRLVRPASPLRRPAPALPGGRLPGARLCG